MITLGGVHVSVYVVPDPDGEARMRLSVDLDEVSPDLLNGAGVLPVELLMGGQCAWWGS